MVTVGTIPAGRDTVHSSASYIFPIISKSLLLLYTKSMFGLGRTRHQVRYYLMCTSSYILTVTNVTPRYMYRKLLYCGLFLFCCAVFSEQDRRATASSLQQASQKHGVLFLKGHGITAEHRQLAFENSRYEAYNPTLHNMSASGCVRVYILRIHSHTFECAGCFTPEPVLNHKMRVDPGKPCNGYGPRSDECRLDDDTYTTYTVHAAFLLILSVARD